MEELDLSSLYEGVVHVDLYSLNEGVVEVDVLFHKVAVDGRGELHPARQTLAMPNL